MINIIEEKNEVKKESEEKVFYERQKYCPENNYCGPIKEMKNYLPQNNHENYRLAAYNFNIEDIKRTICICPHCSYLSNVDGKTIPFLRAFDHFGSLKNHCKKLHKLEGCILNAKFDSTWKKIYLRKDRGECYFIKNC